jgi:PASTA domain
MPVGRRLRAPLVLVAASLTVGAGASVPAAEGTAPPPATATSTAATVIVPDLFRVNPASAYRRLRRLGLLVTIPTGFVVGQRGLADVQVTGQSPTPLSRVAAGRTVRLRVRCAPCAQLIDVAPPGPLRSAVVPDLTGRRISAAEYWVGHHPETLVIRFGPLMRDAAPKLFGNYRIVHQYPAPGARLAVGVRTGTGNRIVPTPLKITALQQADRRCDSAPARRGL